ncbi:MAG: hypothetical protein AAFN13_14265 [Bacteroidota bacterium]
MTPIASLFATAAPVTGVAEVVRASEQGIVVVIQDVLVVAVLLLLVVLLLP